MGQTATRHDLNAATAVVSFLMTGAFVLQALGIPPLLTQGYTWFFGESPPVYFGLAIGASGVFAVVYQIIYVLLLSPAKCVTDFDFGETPEFTPRKLEPGDFIALFFTFVTYQWVAYDRGLPIGGDVYIGGLLVIVFATMFSIVPRMIAKRVPKGGCFYALRVVFFTLPVTFVLFLPALFLINIFSI